LDLFTVSTFFSFVKCHIVGTIKFIDYSTEFLHLGIYIQDFSIYFQFDSSFLWKPSNFHSSGWSTICPFIHLLKDVTIMVVSVPFFVPIINELIPYCSTNPSANSIFRTF
jgi:hypothetical protein